jgi:hypothetical protein
MDTDFVSGAFGGLLASGLARIRAGGFERWPWIFFGEFLMCGFGGVLALTGWI